jgi:WD40 repeat protein
VTVVARPPAAAKASLPNTPYKGLTHYSENDAAFFFGREDETEIIVANLMASRLTLLYGESGVGKSSLLRAGVARHLTDLALENVARGKPPRVVVVVFPEDDPAQEKRISSWGDDPIPSLAKAIERAVAGLGLEVEAPPSDQPLADLLAAWTELLRSDLLVVLDQFEEYLLYHGDESGEGTLAGELPAALARRGLRASFLVSIREDAVARLDRFKTSIPNLLDNYLRVEHLDRESAEEAIRKPLERWHELGGNAVVPEDALVEAVLKDVPTGTVLLGAGGSGTVAPENEDAIETPFLQLVMERLWEADGASGKLTLATYERLGRAEEIVRTHLDGKMADLGEDDQRVAAKVFQNLVTASGQKVAWTANDLALREKLPKEKVEQVLERLREGRIVRPVAPPPNRPHESRYEIFHDKLADAILTWSTAFNQEEERAAANKRVLFLRGVAAVLSLLLVAAAVAIVLFWRERQATKSQALAGKAISQLPVDPNKALGTALEAARTKRTREAVNALRSALNQAQERVILNMPDAVGSVAWSRDRSRIALASGAAVYVWDVGMLLAHDDTSKPLLILRTPQEVTGVAFGRGNGQIIATAGGDGVRMWNAKTGRVVARFGEYSDSLAIDPRNDHIVATPGYFPEQDVEIWKWGSGRRPKLVKSIPTRGSFASSIFFSPDGTRLATTDFRGRVRAWLWQACTGPCKPFFARERGRELSGGGFNRNGRWLVVGSRKQAVVYDTRKPKSIPQVLTGHWDVVTSASFGPRSLLLVTGSNDGDARVWDWRAGKILLDLPGHDGPVLAAVFSPDRSYVLTGGSDTTARIWSVSTGRELQDTAKPAGDPVTSGEYSSDGRYIVTSSGDGRLRVWAASGRLERRIRVPDGVLKASFVSGRDDSVIAVSRGRVQSWNWRRREAGKFVDGSFYDAAVSGTGADVVTLGRPSTASVVSFLSRKTKYVLLRGDPKHLHDQLYAAAFSRDRYVAVGGDPHTAWIWDLRRCPKPPAPCRPVRVLGRADGLTGAVHGLAFSPDGSRLGAASGDDARVWQWKSRRKPQVLQGNTIAVQTIAFNRDGSEVATGSANGTTVVWSTKQGRSPLPLAVMRMQADLIHSIAFSPDGRSILTTSDDGTARIYPCLTCGASFSALKRLAAEREAWSPPEIGGAR